MNLYYLPSERLPTLLKKLTESYSVYVPQSDDSHAHLVRFDPERPIAADFQKVRTAENCKHFLFPSRDRVARFPDDAEPRIEAICLFGVKACDARGIAVHDRVFMAWQPRDPVYAQRRERMLVVTADCPEPEHFCFCTLVGLKPFGESDCDANITQTRSGFLFEAFTERGMRVVNDNPELFREPDAGAVEEREETRAAALKILKKYNEREFKKNLSQSVENASHEKIREARDECVECHACLHACPTCYCFLLSDHQHGKVMERVRTWDACYYGAYARVGGGANPRGKMDERFWNRFLCKFTYFPAYEKMFACTGCGRCLAGCSAAIDIRKILWSL